MRAKLRNELQEYIERYTKNIQELITVKRRRGIPQWKIDEVKRLKELIKKYRTIGLINIEGVPTKQFKELRGLVSDKVYIKVTKNNLLEIALREVSLPNVDEFVKYLRGPTAVAFTNLNAFELKLLLDKTKVKREARPGDKVTSRIVVPAGNTGIPPGPMISVFGKLKIPTQVREGTIWIAKDTTVAKEGDIISPDLASLLQKLGIEPIEVKLELKAAYDEGLVLPVEKLRVDLDSVRNEVTSAVKCALGLASEIVIPEKPIVELALTKAFMRATELAATAGFITKETAQIVLNKALSQANALATILSSKVPELGIKVEAVAAAPPKAEEKKEEGKEEEKKEEEKEALSEEELGSGLAALFG